MELVLVTYFTRACCYCCCDRSMRMYNPRVFVAMIDCYCFVGSCGDDIYIHADITAIHTATESYNDRAHTHTQRVQRIRVEIAR